MILLQKAAALARGPGSLEAFDGLARSFWKIRPRGSGWWNSPAPAGAGPGANARPKIWWKPQAGQGRQPHPILSHEKSDDPDNLMLLCDRHHREVDDRNKLDIYSVDALLEMKRRHEERVARALMDPDAPHAHILRISAAVGDNETAIPRQACARAMIPQFVIADRHPIDISIRGMEHKDSDPTYYEVEMANLRRVYDREIRGRFKDGDLEHELLPVSWTRR